MEIERGRYAVIMRKENGANAPLFVSVVYKLLHERANNKQLPIIFPHYLRNNTNRVTTPTAIGTNHTADVVPIIAIHAAPKIGAITFGR